MLYTIPMDYYEYEIENEETGGKGVMVRRPSLVSNFGRPLCRAVGSYQIPAVARERVYVAIGIWSWIEWRRLMHRSNLRVSSFPGLNYRVSIG